jgi:hypothetical protein
MILYPSVQPVTTDSHGSATESVPADLDPAAYPIIARHFFGVESSRLVCPLAAEVVADLRRRRHVQQVHRLGDRVFGELLAELGAERGITTIIDQKLERYAELESEVLQAAGGDEFWPTPVREVGDG